MAEQSKTAAAVMRSKQSELLETWLENIVSLAGTRVLELMTEAELRKQTTDLLEALIVAFSVEQYEDIEAPEFAGSVAMLRDTSRSRKTEGQQMELRSGNSDSTGVTWRYAEAQ